MRAWALVALIATGCLAAASTGPAQDYEIGPADVLSVIVLGQPSMTGEMAVDPGGMLDFPFLGRVKAAGMSPPELERKLTTLLADGYLRRPQVSVSVKQYRSHRVYVTGEVVKPGPYGLRPDRSLLTLLQDIGELTANVGHEVVVIRPPPAGWSPPVPTEPATNGDTSTPAPAPAAPPPPGPALPGEVPGAQIHRMNLRDVRSGYPDKDMRLEVGDTVYLPKAAQVYVTGHVARPGAFRYEVGLTVFQALALAGSATDRGSGKVRIVRMIEGKRKELRARLSDALLPEDTVHVPERFF